MENNNSWKLNKDGTLIIKTEHDNILVNNKDLVEDFFDWIDHECDGEEPSKELFEEFLEMENLRGSLIKSIENLQI